MKRRNCERRLASASVCAPVLAPTRERRQHGPIERLDKTIADEAGRSARPYRSVDSLAVMERRGTITAEMRHAGEDFRRSFATAHLDPLRALDYSRPRGGTSVPATADRRSGQLAERARERVWRAIDAVGGASSPGGSCLWHVVGWEKSLKEWASGQGWNGRLVSQEAASGILIAALGALERHYRENEILPTPHFVIDKSGSI